MRTMAIITSSGIIYRDHSARDGMALLMECPPARAHRSFPSRKQAREWAEEWVQKWGHMTRTERERAQYAEAEAAREARAAEYLRLAPEREREAKAHEDERRADTARFLLDGVREEEERASHAYHLCPDCGTDKCSRIVEQRARQERIADLERAIAERSPRTAAETAHIRAAVA